MADTKQDVILVLLACFSTDLLTPTYQLRHVNSRIRTTATFYIFSTVASIDIIDKP